jgi:hypothetical protein
LISFPNPFRQSTPTTLAYSVEPLGVRHNQRREDAGPYFDSVSIPTAHGVNRFDLDIVIPDRDQATELPASQGARRVINSSNVQVMPRERE